MAFPWTAAGTGTDQELLDLTRAAIAQILATGQSYNGQGQAMTRANLAELREMEKHYEEKIAQASTGGFAVNYARLKRR